MDQLTRAEAELEILAEMTRVAVAIVCDDDLNAYADEARLALKGKAPPRDIDDLAERLNAAECRLVFKSLCTRSSLPRVPGAKLAQVLKSLTRPLAQAVLDRRSDAAASDDEDDAAQRLQGLLLAITGGGVFATDALALHEPMNMEDLVLIDGGVADAPALDESPSEEGPDPVEGGVADAPALDGSPSEEGPDPADGGAADAPALGESPSEEGPNAADGGAGDATVLDESLNEEGLDSADGMAADAAALYELTGEAELDLTDARLVEVRVLRGRIEAVLKELAEIAVLAAPGTKLAKAVGVAMDALRGVRPTLRDPRRVAIAADNALVTWVTHIVLTRIVRDLGGNPDALRMSMCEVVGALMEAAGLDRRDSIDPGVTRRRRVARRLARKTSRST